MKTWLILDCNYLCHRAKHTMGNLSYGGSATGVIYGFLKDVLYFRSFFQTNHIVFCWDHGKDIRKQDSLTYKSNRIKEYTKEEQEFEKDFRIQLSKLKKEYLSEIGFSNNFYQKGYEADDIIASVCKNSISKEDDAIIISADHDLYQLLSKQVSIYHPQKQEIYTKKKFKKAFGIKPRQWAKVKAIAGCSSDNISGIKGIGEKTAAKYIAGTLKNTTKTYNIIKENIDSILKTNLILTKIPYPDTRIFDLKEDNLSRKSWSRITKNLGIKSLKLDGTNDNMV